MTRDVTGDLLEQGYAVMRQVLSTVEARALRLRVLDAAGDHPPSDPWDLPAATLIVHELEEVRGCAEIRRLVLRICGPGAHLLIDLLTIRGEGDDGLHWHTDTAVWVPPPFPPSAAVITFGICLSDAHSGGTRFIPGTHRFRDEPPDDLGGDAAGSVEPRCDAGDVVVWLGETWHGRSPRCDPGERVYYVCAFGASSVPQVQRMADPG